MTARAQWPLSAALLLLCAAIGMLAGSAPGLAIFAAIAAGFAWLVITDLTVGAVHLHPRGVRRAAARRRGF